MKPKDVLKHYKSKYRFAKETGFAPASLGNWIKRGFIPIPSQLLLERRTNGLFKAEEMGKNE